MNIETFTIGVASAIAILHAPQLPIRRALHNPNLPNPVTKVAERFAEPQAVRLHIGSLIQAQGLSYLETVKTEVEASKPEAVRDAEAREDADEARQVEKAFLDSLVSPTA